jgi:hypothetical protein
MKYLSLAFIVLCLAFSWRLANSDDPISIHVHNDIQIDLTKIIQSVIQQHLPKSTDFHFSKMYTETLNPSTVQAVFAYAFKDGESEELSERTIEGTALLTRDPSNPNQWTLEDVKVDQSAIEFEKGVIIQAGEETPQ